MNSRPGKGFQMRVAGIHAVPMLDDDHVAIVTPEGPGAHLPAAAA